MFCFPRTVHFIFPSKKDSKEEDRQFSKDDEDEDMESFKNNRVLIAIAEGRLPDERPNYDYFARLLGADADVNLRPKQCWIFVSSTGITLRERQLPAAEDAAATSGTGGNSNTGSGASTARKQLAGYDASGRRILTEAEYPHLRLNEDKDYKRDLACHGGEPSVLLHEYTRTLTQKESCSVREISKKWGVRFPELAEKLSTALSGNGGSSSSRGAAAAAADERTSRCVMGPCDTFHFEVVLDLHANAKFPEGSHCNGMVELAISRPDLHGHSWRSVTTVVKPDALYFGDKEPDWHERTSAVDVNPSHRVGCPAAAAMQRSAGGAGVHNFPCDCTARGSRDTILVGFPASSWANTFVMLASYVSAAREEQAREREYASQNQRKTGGRSRGKQQQKQQEDAESSSQQQQQQKKSPPPPNGSKKKALVDLLSEVAMYQEIWSAPNESASNAGMMGRPGSVGENGTNGSGANNGKRQAWTRRAVILWTFVPVHEKIDDKGKTSVLPAGTNWRFMTKLDPTSQYHQQRAYLNRDAVMSANPSYAHHVHTAAMHEHFGTAAATTSAMYDHPAQVADMGMPPTTLSHPHHTAAALAAGNPHLTGLNLLDAGAGYVDVSACGVGSDGGLATPPPSASLQSSSGYSHAFDGASFDGGVRGRGSIASTMSGSVDSGSVISGGGLHVHHAHPNPHHHPHQQPHPHLGFVSAASTEPHVNGSNLVATDPFLSDLGGAGDAGAAVGMGGSPYGDASPTDCDPSLQAWAAQGMQGLGDPGPWSYAADEHPQSHNHLHHQQISTTWAEDARDLTTGAIGPIELQDAVQQWGANGSPTHSWGGEHDQPHDQDAWAAWQALGDGGAGTPSWDEHPTVIAPSANSDVGASGPGLHDDGHHQNRQDGLLLGPTGLTPLRNTISRKRSRCESFDDADGDDSSGEAPYPVSSLRRKLSHQSGTAAAPTAVMGDDFQL